MATCTSIRHSTRLASMRPKLPATLLEDRMLRSALVLLPAVLLFAGAASANKVFVSNERGNSVTVLDSQSWEVIATFPAGNRPRGITISPDGKELYVCASDDDTVRVFDTETYKELHTLPS